MENPKNLKTADLLLKHGYIVTMDEKRHIFRDGAIAIKDGKICAINTTGKIEEEFSSPEVMDLKNNLVHPGLVDAHQHITMLLARSWLPDYYSQNEIFEKFEKPLFQNKTVEVEFYGTILGCMEMVLNGTTTFGDTGGATDIDRIFEAIKTVGLKGRFGHGISDIMEDPLDFINYSTRECLKKIEYQISRYPTLKDQPIGCWAGMRGMGTCSDKLIMEAKKLADSYGTMFVMHQSCFEYEVRETIKKLSGKKRPIEHLYDLGILGPETILVHMIYLSPEEIEIIAETGTGIVHCPGASTRNAMSSSIYGSFPEMIKENIPVALGSDQGNSSDGLDIFRMAYLAAVIHKEARRTMPAISVEAAMEMATINGARVMGMEKDIGSLEAGKSADIVIHNLDHPGSHPPFDPLNNAILSIQSKSVDTVLINGKTIVRHSKLTEIDTGEILKIVDKKADELAKQMGYTVKRTWPVIV